MVLETEFLTQYALLFLRIIIAIIFFSSGYKHLQKPFERGKSIEMSATATSVLGFVEVVGAISIAFGIFVQIGAILIIMIMAGAIYKKIIEWKISFYAEEGFGWHYDLLLLLATFVIFTTGGGRWIIF